MFVDNKTKLNNKLSELSDEEMEYFAWIRAVRILPFLGCFGNFDYWKSDMKQYHLMSVFRAIDFTALIAIGRIFSRTRMQNFENNQFDVLYRALILSAFRVKPALAVSTSEVYFKRADYIKGLIEGTINDSKIYLDSSKFSKNLKKSIANKPKMRYP